MLANDQQQYFQQYLNSQNHQQQTNDPANGQPTFQQQNQQQYQNNNYSKTNKSLQRELDQIKQSYEVQSSQNQQLEIENEKLQQELDQIRKLLHRVNQEQQDEHESLRNKNVLLQSELKTYKNALAASHKNAEHFSQVGKFWDYIYSENEHGDN